MRASGGSESESGCRNAGLYRVDSTGLAAKGCISRSRPTPLLCSEQLSSHHIQIGQRCGDFQPVQVLGQTPVAGLAEAEDILDYAEHVLDLGAHPRLVTVLGLLDLVDP